MLSHKLSDIKFMTFIYIIHLSLICTCEFSQSPVYCLLSVNKQWFKHDINNMMNRPKERRMILSSILSPAMI